MHNDMKAGFKRGNCFVSVKSNFMRGFYQVYIKKRMEMVGIHQYNIPKKFDE
jgi:hypothetical protein